MESANPLHNTELVGFYMGFSLVHLTILATKQADYTRVPQHLQHYIYKRAWASFLTEKVVY